MQTTPSAWTAALCFLAASRPALRAQTGFPPRHTFPDDLLSAERKEDHKFAKNMLTFGWGPHYCVGERAGSPPHPSAAALPLRGSAPPDCHPASGAEPCAPMARSQPCRRVCQASSSWWRLAGCLSLPSPFLFSLSRHDRTSSFPPRGDALAAGKEYATNHLMCFLAIVSTTCDWTRRRTPESDKWLCECSTAACLILIAAGGKAMGTSGRGLRVQGDRARGASEGGLLGVDGWLSQADLYPPALSPCADLPTIYPADSLICLKQRK